MTDLLTLDEYAAAYVDPDTRRTGVMPRTVRKWLADGRLPDAVMVGKRRMIPADARPGPVVDLGELHQDEAPTDRALAPVPPAALTLAPPTGAGAGAGPLVLQWFTVDEVVQLWRGLVSRRRIIAMLEDGRLAGDRIGPRGTWLVRSDALVVLW
jgi:hypothetical protein